MPCVRAEEAHWEGFHGQADPNPTPSCQRTSKAARPTRAARHSSHQPLLARSSLRGP